MQNPRLASRYAKSLLDLVVEQNNLEATLKDMQLLDAICTQSSDFAAMLRSPIISGDKKLNVVRAVVAGRISPLTQQFIELLVTKGRELNLSEIAQAFIAQYKEMKHIKTVNLTTAVAIDEKLKNSILEKVAANMSNDAIDLKMNVDESLIGGFVLEVENKLLDMSIKRSLTDVKNRIVDMSYVSKL